MKFKSLFKGFAAALIAIAAASACTQQAEELDTLSVQPSAALSFEADGNADVTLTVTTTADEWGYTAPEWVTATPAGETLIVNVQDNTGKARVGRISFTAGTAHPVNINVHQAAPKAEVPSGETVAATLNNKAESDFFQLTSGAVTGSVSVTLASAAAEDVVVELTLDPRYVEEYSFITGDVYEAVPTEAVSFAKAEVTIAAGETESEAVDVVVDGAALGFGQGYLVPVMAVVKSGNASFATDAKRVNYVVMKANPRTTKQVVYLEVNDCNPLNILEYNLADGTPFFDAVILFAANINYDSVNDVVYLHNNPNVQALLDESETYIQPLRKKGIKVYLGLLGNHDAAGLAQLSDWGAHEWAQEVAEACRVYKLDGVNLDDEYSGYPDLNNPWFTNQSAAAGARLCYELKMALKEKCYWPTDVSIFEWGALYNLPTVNVDGVEYTQSQFLDWTCANYGSASRPYGDLTYANCSGASIQLNYGNSIYDNTLENIKNNGYGWVMWFAFDPSGTGGISNNRTHSMTQFEKTAQALYGQGMAQPENVYNKLGEGKYDPTPHAIN
ncbi:MAG: DUF1735 domain-containing protein [Bacteroidales bacterium]|nr:DUF1735 domain-containing protein [Bacteroidales bacterium]